LIAGYVTFENLLFITGLPKKCLKDLLDLGVRSNYIVYRGQERSLPNLYNLKEVEQFLKMNMHLIKY
jgi:hypothetical protein